MEVKSKWQDAIDQGLRIRGTSLIPAESAKPAEPPRPMLDHRQAIIKLDREGRTRREIRDAMLAAGYFKGKTHHQVSGSIRAVLDGYDKKPVRRSTTNERIDQMLRHSEFLAKRKIAL